MVRFATRFGLPFILATVLFGTTMTWGADSIFKSQSNGIRVGVLPNGLRAILLPARTQSVIVRTRVSRGFADERISSDPALNEAGATHLLEHLLFRGTVSYPDVDSVLKKEKIKTNANTDWDETNYFKIGEKDAIETMLKVQASMLREPLLADEAILSENKPVAEELHMRARKSPMVDLIWLSLAAHARQRASHLMAGGVEEVKGIAPQTIRDLYERLYSADNMTLVVAGGIDDLDKVEKLIVEEYGKIPRRPTSPAASMQAEFMPLAGEAQKLVKVKTEVAGRRLLNVQFPVQNVDSNGNGTSTEHAAILLKRYLNRKGEGTALQPLIDRNLVKSYAVDVDTYRDQSFVRMIFELTMAGEHKLAEVMGHLTAVTGTIAKEGLPQVVFNELKANYALTHIEGRGLMDIAEELAKAEEKYGLDKLTDHPKRVLSVNIEEIKELASRLNPEVAQPTLITPSAKGQFDPKLERIIERTEMPEAIEAMRKAFGQGGEKQTASPNPLLHLDDPRLIGDKKHVAILVSPDASETTVEAALEFSYSKKLTALERMAADMAFLAFRLDPKNARLFDQISEAGVALELRFSPSDMRMSMTGSGKANIATKALYQVLKALRSYEPNEAAFARAKEQFIDRLRELPATDVTIQSLIIGFNQVMGSNAIDVSSRVAAAEKVAFGEAKVAFAKSQASWGVKGILSGNWSDAALVQTVPLMLPQNGELLVTTPHEAPLAKGSYPELVGRVAQVDRQGVARLFPVAVKEYSADFFAFKIFSKIASRKLMDVVRTELGLAYDVRAGFETLETGGSALYFVGDTSKHAFHMAHGFTVTLHDLLYRNVITEADFNEALAEVVQETQGKLNGSDGIFARLFEGVDPKAIEAAIKQVTTLESVMSIVRPQLEASNKLDAVAVDSKDPVCKNLLMKP